MTTSSSAQVVISALPGVPIIKPGDNLPALIGTGLTRAEISLADGDAIVVASTLLSRAAGLYCDLRAIEASARAHEVAATTGHDPRLVELILRESQAISRMAPGVLIVRHRSGIVSANAGIDQSNAEPPDADPGSGPWVLCLPENPDADAASIRAALHERLGVSVGVVISDSVGRPFRFGTVGIAIGSAGLPALLDYRGRTDLFERPLMHTEIALADQIAGAADMVAGQADEGRGIIHVRGLSWPVPEPNTDTAHALVRPPERDLYA